jgi:hypothetical protein
LDAVTAWPWWSSTSVAEACAPTSTNRCPKDAWSPSVSPRTVITTGRSASVSAGTVTTVAWLNDVHACALTRSLGV